MEYTADLRDVKPVGTGAAQLRERREPPKPSDTVAIVLVLLIALPALLLPISLDALVDLLRYFASPK